jgi:serine/threonine protein kinase
MCSGHMASEFINRQVISEKSDIYSLGSVMLQLMTGRKTRYYDNMSQKEFIELVNFYLFQ